MSLLSRFICRDEEERAWLLDMHARLVPVSWAAIAVVTVLMTACIQYVELTSFPAMSAGIAALIIGDLVTRRTRRLEPLVICWFIAVTGIGLSVLLTALKIPLDGSTIAVGMTILLWPLALACGGFPSRVVVACTAYACLWLVVPALVFWLPAMAAHPTLLVTPLATMITVPIITSAVRQASVEHRAAAVVDPLTGMLNRAALTSRAAELEHQSELTGEGVGVLVMDLDHFKAVNDTHGHAAGDLVLQEIAYRLRKQLSAFEMSYRLGGEEFLVLLPGATPERAQAIVSRLWASVRSQPIAGLPITASFGVAVSPAGDTFDFDETFRAADAALYEAKAAGRDRIAVGELAPDGSAAPRTLRAA
ncbi:MAG: GGDEF domain-containing protein [Solirubrobacteraceae bacterium]|nr:GGDEF domain-containing protein [Solirubrobacteraceae bacterium]